MNAMLNYEKQLKIPDLVQQIETIQSLVESENTYPKLNKRFRAFDLTPPKNVKVVILGQEPYHHLDQANGLAFSTDKSIKCPPSLKNILKELKDDLNIERGPEFDGLAEQGVLLINAVLTVEDNTPGSHFSLGWEQVTDQILSKLSDIGGIAFVLWGKKAQEKLDILNLKNNLVLIASHPSPHSANKGFFGSKPFSKINKFLKEINKSTIDWSK